MNDENIKLQKSLKQIDFLVCLKSDTFTLKSLIQCNFLINVKLFWRRVYSWLPLGNIIQNLEQLYAFVISYIISLK